MSSALNVVPVPSEEAALAAVEQLPASILVHDDPGGELRGGWLARFAQCPDVRHLMIGTGRRRVARIAEPRVVAIDGNSMRRQSLLHAAAVAAGRASPEIGYQHRPSADLPTEPIASTSVAEARARGQLILVAEDDATNQKVLLRQLELLGYAAEVAADGLEALCLWRKGGYALLLTDLHMPKLDGYTLASAIRAEEEPDRRIPIIALTANALRGEAGRAKAAGIDEYLTKPMQLAVLRQAIEAWLPRHGGFDGSGGTAAHPAHPGQGASAIDLSVLKSMVGDDEATLRELLQDYERSARQALEEIGRAHAGGDAEHVGAVAHRLKSSSRAMGAVLLGDLCAQLENACKKQDQAETTRVVTALGDVAQDVLRSVRGALDE
jgi:CheY-like chemotaxis protein/HPt (histidine-containing phosphotransfer) domain-containing protein